jgi:hypothetical protein
MSVLNIFCTQLVAFFEELAETIPEEKEIKAALEAVKGAKKINPRLILDLFYENIYRGFYDVIQERNLEELVRRGRLLIATQYNEISPAITIFDKHWASLSDPTREAIWKYMLLLCRLVEKARSSA